MSALKRSFLAKLLPLLAVTLVAGAIARAAQEVIRTSYTYTLGDNDSKVDARRICFLEAKRQALEKAGVYLESTSEVDKLALKRDEIRTYSAAVLRVEVESERIEFTGGTTVLHMTVSTVVDPAEVARSLERIAQDRQAQQKITEQQAHIARLEDDYRKMRKDLGNASENEVVELRKESNLAFEKLTELEKVKVTISDKTQAAVQSVALGMTIDEVIRAAGEPRQRASCSERTYLNYGKVWVCFVNSLAKGLVPSEKFEGPCWPYSAFGDLTPLK